MTLFKQLEENSINFITHHIFEDILFIFPQTNRILSVDWEYSNGNIKSFSFLLRNRIYQTPLPLKSENYSLYLSMMSLQNSSPCEKMEYR